MQYIIVQMNLAPVIADIESIGIICVETSAS